jgi:hypothetical protein
MELEVVVVNRSTAGELMLTFASRTYALYAFLTHIGFDLETITPPNACTSSEDLEA